MKLPNLLTFKHDQFSWQAGCGLAEASTLGFRAGECPMGPVYDDACDVGFEVIGKTIDLKTGKPVVLLFTCYQASGAGWYFQSVERVNGKIIGIHILND